jgi:hypothetical protein
MVMTLDEFAKSERIWQIDLLKIDTEGYDLEVLRGATRLLAEGAIKFVIAEVGFSPGDNRHVLFDDVRSLLIPFGYRLFGIYNQQLERSGPRFIRYTDVCFCHSSVFALEDSYIAENSMK